MSQSQDSQSRRSPAPSSLFTQVDVNTGSEIPPQRQAQLTHGLVEEQTEILRDILSSIDRNNEILEELVSAFSAANKQRGSELDQWKRANPHLAQECREAAEGLSQVQVQFLKRLTEEVNDSLDTMLEGEFMLNEFVDRFGPRLAHLNGVIQVLAQLSSTHNPTDTGPL